MTGYLHILLPLTWRVVQRSCSIRRDELQGIETTGTLSLQIKLATSKHSKCCRASSRLSLWSRKRDGMRPNCSTTWNRLKYILVTLFVSIYITFWFSKQSRQLFSNSLVHRFYKIQLNQGRLEIHTLWYIKCFESWLVWPPTRERFICFGHSHRRESTPQVTPLSPAELLNQQEALMCFWGIKCIAGPLQGIPLSARWLKGSHHFWLVQDLDICHEASNQKKTEEKELVQLWKNTIFMFVTGICLRTCIC